MQAVRIHAFGPAAGLKIGIAPESELRPDDVLIRVVASGVNPIEWKIRSGAMAQALARELPATLGWECAGVVQAVGTEATALKPGDEVYTYPEFARDGTHAEQVAVNQMQVAKKPTSLSFEQAAAVPMTAQAAWTALEAAQSVSGKRVLIHGAAGSVGHWLTQLASQRGAHVFATASGADLATVRSLGAEETIDYRQQRFEEHGRFDVVFDLVGGETQARSWGVLEPGGTLISTVAPPDSAKGASIGATGKFVFTPPRGTVLAELATLLDEEQLKPLPVASIRTLSDIEAIHVAGETGTLRGKVVIAVSTP